MNKGSSEQCPKYQVAIKLKQIFHEKYIHIKLSKPSSLPFRVIVPTSYT